MEVENLRHVSRGWRRQLGHYSRRCDLGGCWTSFDADCLDGDIWVRRRCDVRRRVLAAPSMRPRFLFRLRHD
jgi:hypothetical protein